MGVARLIGSVARGKVAAIAGTIAMDAVWYSRYRRGGGDRAPLDWEFGGVDGWDEVSAPGQVGEKVLTAITGKRPPDSWAGLTQNWVHWATGISWGAALGLVSLSRRRPWWLAGPLLGVAAWLTSYALLPLLKIYKPMWEYDARTLAKDLSAHLIFGTTTAATFTALR